MAEALAERLRGEAGEEAGLQVRRGFLLSFGREPDDAEVDSATGLIEQHGLRAFCRVLLNANEMVTVR